MEIIASDYRDWNCQELQNWLKNELEWSRTLGLHGVCELDRTGTELEEACYLNPVSIAKLLLCRASNSH